MASTPPSIRGDIDTTYHTQQRDMFASGLAAEIGVNAFAVWHAIKSHADFQTGGQIRPTATPMPFGMPAMRWHKAQNTDALSRCYRAS